MVIHLSFKLATEKAWQMVCGLVNKMKPLAPYFKYCSAQSPPGPERMKSSIFCKKQKYTSMGHSDIQGQPMAISAVWATWRNHGNTRYKIQTTRSKFPTIAVCLKVTTKGEFINLCGTERLQQHSGEEPNSPGKRKKGMAVPTSSDLNNCPLIYICLQGSNYGSYRPHAFKKAFWKVLFWSQQSHGFFKANLQQVKVGESREAPFKQAQLTQEVQVLPQLCWESAGNSRHQQMTPWLLPAQTGFWSCHQQPPLSGYLPAGISCHLPLSKTQILPPTLLWLERRRLSCAFPKSEDMSSER